jgi:hypothetical protein
LKGGKVKTKKIFPVFLLLLFLGGCSHNKVGAEAALSLDDAITAAHDRCAGDVYNCYSYWVDLEKLWDQTEGDERELIEHEMLKYLLKRIGPNGDPWGRTSADLRSLGEKSTSNDIKKAVTKALEECERIQEVKAEQEQEDKQAQEQKQAEEIRLAFRESRDHLIRICAGRLDDKPVEQVKKLVEDWNPQKSNPNQFYWFSLEFLPTLNDEELRIFRCRCLL